MGYDYSKQFLAEHAVTVQQLTELANTDDVAVMTYADPKELNRARLIVSNILASLALNYPDQYKGLRERIRTWTEFDKAKEVWCLFVGNPRHKITGRRPGLLPGQRHIAAYGPAGQSGAPEELWSKPISNKEEFEEFVRFVAGLSAGTQRVRAELADPPDNENFLRVFQSIGWQPSMQGPTTIALKRPHKETDRNADA